MAKNKDVRVTITLECSNCAQNNRKKIWYFYKYNTQNNRRNTPIRLELGFNFVLMAISILFTKK